MHIFYICGINMGIFIKTKSWVLSEAMDNSHCEHLPHSGEHGKISSRDSRVCMEICIHTIKHSEEKKHSLYSVVTVSACFLKHGFNKKVRSITWCTILQWVNTSS